MHISTARELEALLDQLDNVVADDLESETLEFEPWEGGKNSLN